MGVITQCALTEDPWLLTFSFLPIFPVTQDKLVTFTSSFDLSFAASWTSVSAQSSLTRLYNLFLLKTPSPPPLPPFPFSSVTTISSSMWKISRCLSWTQVTRLPDSALQPPTYISTCLSWKCWTKPVHTDLVIFSTKPTLPLVIPTSVMDSTIYPLADTREPRDRPLFLFLPCLPHLAHYQASSSQPLQYP